MLPLMLMVLAVCVTATPRSELRFTVVVTLLVLLALLESITEVEETDALSLKVLPAEAAKAALGKLPGMMMVPVLTLAKERPVQPVAVQPEADKLPPSVTVPGEKPAGRVFAMLTLVASLRPAFVTVK